MTALSSAAWIVHDVGLATSIGGSMFGRMAFEPALSKMNAQQRDRIEDAAWRRFSWLNLAGHAAFAVPWIIGRTMLSGAEVNGRARALVRVKDELVGASVVTGIATISVGRILGRRLRDGENATEGYKRLEQVTAVLGQLNLLATTGIAAVTSP